MESICTYNASNFYDLASQIWCKILHKALFLRLKMILLGKYLSIFCFYTYANLKDYGRLAAFFVNFAMNQGYYV